VLSVLTRDGAPSGFTYKLGDVTFDCPRWSPDDRKIAVEGHALYNLEGEIQVVPVDGSKARTISRIGYLQGIGWLRDRTGLVLSSPQASTILYPLILNLRTIQDDGGENRQLTYGEVSYLNPDVQLSNGDMYASRRRVQSDVWRIPVTGAANAAQAGRLTSQIGQNQVPFASADGTEVAYLSNSGGHANPWIAKSDGSGTRQLTFEMDPAVGVGLPHLSPTGEWIAFVKIRNGLATYWLIHPDGSGLRPAIPEGAAGAWSGDGKYLYYAVQRNADSCVDKLRPADQRVFPVRCQGTGLVSVAPDGSALYSTCGFRAGSEDGRLMLCRSAPESAPPETLARILANRAPYTIAILQPVISPDGKWLALPLTDHGTTSLGAYPTAGGEPKRLTDFGSR